VIDESEAQIGDASSAVDAGETMHIHKPKAAHSAREFLSEIGVIVVGILIALGLEQAVEAFHWREVVNEERGALRVEIGNLRSAILARIELEPCYESRLMEVSELVRRHDEGKPLGVVGIVGRPLYRPTLRPSWDLAVSDQSLSHMKLAEQRRFMNAYAWVTVYERITGDERAAWRSLQVLNHASALTVADWSQVRKDYQQAVETNWIISATHREWLKPLDELHADAESASVRHLPPVEAFCKPMLTQSPKAPARRIEAEDPPKP
jgi:hypothetical protein